MVPSFTWIYANVVINNNSILYPFSYKENDIEFMSHLLTLCFFTGGWQENGDPALSHVVKVFSRGRWFVFTICKMAHSSTPGTCTAKGQNLLPCRAARAASASVCGKLQSGPRYIKLTVSWRYVKDTSGSGPCFSFSNRSWRSEECFLRVFLPMLLNSHSCFFRQHSRGRSHSHH